MGSKRKNGQPLYTKTLLVNNRPINFIIDTGSPLTLSTKANFNNITVVRHVTEDYREFNGNKTKFEGKTTANIEVNG